MVAEAVTEQQRREFGNAPASGAYQVSGQFNPSIGTGLIVNLLLMGNVTVGQPIGFTPPPGTVMYLIMTQDSTGSRTVTWSACFRDTPNWSAGGAAGTVASGEFRWDGNSWQYVGGSSAFAAPGISIFTGAGQIQLAPAAPVVKSNPAPSVGALTVSGVVATIIRGTSTVIAPTVGAAAAGGGGAVIQGFGIVPPATPGFSLVAVGQPVTRTP